MYVCMNNKHSVIFRFGHLLLILALLGATGAHWAALQSVAWATMLADNARTTDLGEALVKTFDGKHPCQLCKQIAQGRKSEKKSDAQTDFKRLEFFQKSFAFFISPPGRFVRPSSCDSWASHAAEAPPVPPPRSLQG